MRRRCTRERDAKDKEGHTQHQRHPQQGLHRPKDREHHHPELAKELHDSDHPSDSEDPENTNHTEHRDAPPGLFQVFGVAGRSGSRSGHQLEDQLEQTEGNDGHVHHIPPPVVILEELQKAVAEPAQGQLHGEDCAEEHLQHHKVHRRCRILLHAPVGESLCLHCGVLRLPGEEDAVQQDEDAAAPLIVAAADHSLETRAVRVLAYFTGAEELDGPLFQAPLLLGALIPMFDGRLTWEMGHLGNCWCDLQRRFSAHISGQHGAEERIHQAIVLRHDIRQVRLLVPQCGGARLPTPVQ
mmetsp:Transcript_132714/g.370034  ORF Transcript_132714/g.370034 Transcript_132714/m.370034 type:complete len:297 (+) Transcript_132714:824-1714(+)